MWSDMFEGCVTALQEGWVTIDGVHVHFNGDGEMDKGPKALQKTFNRKHVGEHIVKTGGKLDADMYARNLSHDQYELKQIPLPDVAVETKGNAVASYKKMKTQAPAIVMGANGKVYDGNHRVQAARARGESHILAYVPKEKK